MGPGALGQKTQLEGPGKDFWSSGLEDAWKAASRALAVKDVTEYLVIFVLMWKISHIYVTVCLDSHLFS